LTGSEELTAKIYTAITWRSAKQTIIAKSTMESEFVALELTGSEDEWLRNFLANIPLGL
jgi:hypothetical protein